MHGFCSDINVESSNISCRFLASIIFYHGSNVEIKTIDLSKSKPYKDFGRGFYLSADRKQAIRMAEPSS